MSVFGMAEPAVTLNEVQAYVRIETGEEEAIVAGLIRAASALCESFINQVVIARTFAEDVRASGGWERLGLSPIRSIANVASIDDNGTTSTLLTGDYSIDVDSSGDGWIRVLDSVPASRVRVTGTAGMATSENEVPEPIRQGILRLVAHLFTSRDGGGGSPPAAVTALWRPYRRLRVA